MPRILIYAVLILIFLAFLPPVIIARIRSKPSPSRPIHIVQDMDLGAVFSLGVFPGEGGGRVLRVQI